MQDLLSLSPDELSAVYDVLTPDERTELERHIEALTIARENWQEWLDRRFPNYLSSSFAPHHIEYWDWIDALTPGISPSPFVACWSRGGGKSTTNELGVARVCDKLSRRYPLIISSTQEKADERVQTVSTLLETMGIERRLSRYGHSRGWRRQQLQAANGFNFSGFGLDAGQRGVKIEQYRPDWIILDDIDELTDSLTLIEKKIEIITKSIIPAGSPDLAISFTQNAIHRESIMSRMIDGRAEFLTDRNRVTPIPALRGMRTEEREGKLHVVNFGEPTWEGQGIEVCKKQIANMGLPAFLTECQHDVYTNVANARFKNATLNTLLEGIRNGEHTPLSRLEVTRTLSSYPELLEVSGDNSLKLWERPQAGVNYLLSVDCTEGLNPEGIADFDCVQIINAEEWTQAGILHGRWESYEFAQLLDALGNLFGGETFVLIAVLRNRGESVLSHMVNNHHWRKRIGREWGGLYYYDEQEVLNRVETTATGGRKPGFPENIATKPVMITALADAIEQEAFVFRDEETLMECLTYVKLPGGKTGGMSGCNDDRVSSLALGILLLSIRYDRRTREREEREEREEEEEEGYAKRGWSSGKRRSR